MHSLRSPETELLLARGQDHGFDEDELRRVQPRSLLLQRA